MLSFPNCKINLGLYITHRRSDGYHDLETVFYPVPLTDVLEIVPAAKTSLHLSGLAVAGNDNDNLVWKAYNLLKAEYADRLPPLDIYLHKVVPMGAGLGGGSADGAFMLRAINTYCQLNLSNTQLTSLALQLGSDCPFFIHNTPQYATGRGEQMQDCAIDLSAYSIQLICPTVHVSTRAAFGMITPRPAPFHLAQLPALPIEDWKHHISNDFEVPVFSQHPALANIKQQLYAQGALYASMSGSGSALYGIFRKGERATINAAVDFRDVYTD